MKSFKDNAGRTWTVCVNIDAVKRVRALLHVDLLDAAQGDLVERLSSDPVLLCDLVYCLVKPEADALNVSDADFGRALAGDAIDAATTALLEELVDFFPAPKRRLLKKALGKLTTLQAEAVNLAEAQLDALDLQTVLKTSGAPSGTSPASWVSIPDPSRSAN